MEETKPFCNSCGLCCAKVGTMVEEAKKLVKQNPRIGGLTAAVANFPHKYDERGRCEKLGQDNSCTIYMHRPLVCSIKGLYDKFYKNVMTRKKFYDLSEKECMKLIAEHLQLQTPSENLQP